MCRQLHGTLPLPDKNKNLTETFGLLLQQIPPECDGRFWIPIRQSPDNQSRFEILTWILWVYFSTVHFRWFKADDEKLSHEVHHLEWGYGQPNGHNLQPCVIYESRVGGYDDEECMLKICPSCQFNLDVHFTLKGICPGVITSEENFLSPFTFRG